MTPKTQRLQMAAQGPGNIAHILSGMWFLTRTSLLQEVPQTLA